MSYYPDKQAFEFAMADIAGEAQERVYNDIMRDINKTLDDLKNRVDVDTYRKVWCVFRDTFGNEIKEERQCEKTSE